MTSVHVNILSYSPSYTCAQTHTYIYSSSMFDFYSMIILPLRWEGSVVVDLDALGQTRVLARKELVLQVVLIPDLFAQALHKVKRLSQAPEA